MTETAPKPKMSLNTSVAPAAGAPSAGILKRISEFSEPAAPSPASPSVFGQHCHFALPQTLSPPGSTPSSRGNSPARGLSPQVSSDALRVHYIPAPHHHHDKHAKGGIARTHSHPGSPAAAAAGAPSNLLRATSHGAYGQRTGETRRDGSREGLRAEAAFLTGRSSTPPASPRPLPSRKTSFAEPIVSPMSPNHSGSSRPRSPPPPAPSEDDEDDENDEDDDDDDDDDEAEGDNAEDREDDDEAEEEEEEEEEERLANSKMVQGASVEVVHWHKEEHA